MARTVDLQTIVNALPNGSVLARKRIYAILASSAGIIQVQEAAESLGCSTQHLYVMRTGILQAALDAAEPKPVGRPSTQPSEETQKLQQRVKDLENELRDQKILHEIQDLRSDMIALGMDHKLAGLKKNDHCHPSSIAKSAFIKRKPKGSPRPTATKNHLRRLS